MKISYYLLTLVIGVALTVHLAMNGKVGSVLDNARVANAIFWCIGAAAAVAIGITGWREQVLIAIKETNPFLFLAGAIGACLVFGIAFLIPRIGAAKLTLIMLAGQILGGLVLSQYGLLGSPREPISFRSALGAAIMFAGVVMAIL
jgi:transporter family-2 protein